MPVDEIYIVPVLLAGAYYTGTILGPALLQYQAALDIDIERSWRRVLICRIYVSH